MIMTLLTSTCHYVCEANKCTLSNLFTGFYIEHVYERYRAVPLVFPFCVAILYTWNQQIHLHCALYTTSTLYEYFLYS